MADQEAKSVTIRIQAMLGEAKPLFPAECCIYRVPYKVRQLNPDAYTPKVVSIGPFHYGSTRLQNMEGHKQIYFQKFLDRSEKSLEELVECVQILEPKVRSSYSENIGLSKEEFMKVILVDCGFIFELFLRYHFRDWTDDDAIFSKEWLKFDIMVDLLLLENQLPFFVFVKLYELAFAFHLGGHHPSRYPSFLNLSVQNFDAIIWQNYKGTDDSVAHFTDLVRNFYLPPSDQRPSRVPGMLPHLHSVTELNEAGVKFMVNEASQCSLLDLEFSGRILKIPQIAAQDLWTETMFGNLLALELCHYPNECYVTDYVAVLDFLINTDKDVEILVKNGIIVNWFGDNYAVAKIFNGLWRHCTQPNFNDNYFDVCQKLNAFCKHPLHRRVATLRRDYCNTPWKTVASIAAIVLLVLTVVQAVCSVLQVKHY